MNEHELDKTLDEIRLQDAPAGELAAAQERVWQKLSTPGLCQEFRAQFAEYRNGTLASQRMQLMQDHLMRCVDCRRAFAAFEGRNNVIAMPAVRTRKSTLPYWAMAAGVTLAALWAGRDRADAMLAPGGPRATVQSINGMAYGLDGNSLTAGAPLAEAQVFRTGAGARAMLNLSDGSTVEVNESSQLFVRAAWSGQSIHLERGDVIVHAAKQRRGSLRVITRDSVASVKGTVFTVSTGNVGSLVGVVEGSVAVDQSNGNQLLKPGEQANTNAALSQITVREAVAWSPNAEQYFTLLAEFAAIEKKLPALPARTELRLLNALPLNAVIYGAIPNLGPTINQAVAMIEQRSTESPVLKQWWQSASGAETKALVDRVKALYPLLGDEIVFVLLHTGTTDMPALLAEVKGGQQAAVKAAIDKLTSTKVYYQFVGNLLVVSGNQAELNSVLGQLGKGAATPFAAEIAKHYKRGVSSLLGVDLAEFQKSATKVKELELAGVGNLRYLFVEQRNPSTGEENEASLTFAGSRTGMASWLGTPAAAGSAEYVSSDALFAFSAATRNPRQIFDEMVSMMSRLDSNFTKALREAEAKTGVQFSTDLAAALGTDFTVAVEAATIPIPGWVAAMEVYRPELYNATMRNLVNAFNREADQQMKLVWTEETVNGRAWTKVQLAGQPFSMHWTFDRGYLVQGMDRALVLKAINTRTNGFPLVRSAKYRDQLPTSSGLHQSGFVWVNLGGTLSGFASMAPNAGVQKLLATREPGLLTFMGETERITSASRTRLSSLLFDMLLVQAQPGLNNK